MKNLYLPTSDSQTLLEPLPTSREKLKCWWSIPLIMAIILIMGIATVTLFFKFPTPLPDTAVNSHRFIEARARQYLEKLTSFGPRNFGSDANGIDAVNFLVTEIEKIIHESKAHYEIEYEIQESDFTYGLKIFYSVQNVIVRIEATNNSQSGALLLNSHIDSQIGSPGAGDDGTMVAVMLEILRVMTKSDTAVRHPVIFLFNCPEELGLMGSKVFLQHRWSKEVTTFINLEGMGVGGKEVLFNVNPKSSWLLDYYSSTAKHPFANVVCQEVFQNGLIPGNTDYKIFSNGGFVGLDFGYIFRGYFYHTTLDQFRFIDEGTLQHTGDNILALTQSLANADQIGLNQSLPETGKAVFFDVFGLFMINYSETTAVIVNSVICVVCMIAIIVSLWTIDRSTKKSDYPIFVQLVLTLLTHLVSLAIAGGVTYGIRYGLNSTGYSMAWFSQPWVIFGLYSCPYIFITGICSWLFLRWRQNELPYRFGILYFLHSNCLVLVSVDLALTILEFRSAYIVTLPIMFYTISLVVNIVAGLYNKPRWWILSILIGQIIPIAYLTYFAEIMFSIFIPIAGRISPDDNPETRISAMAMALTILLFGFIIPIVNVFEKAKWVFSSTLVIFMIFCALSITVWHPYRADASPQRQVVDHALKIKYDVNGKVVSQKAFYIMYLMDTHTLETLEDIFRENDIYPRKQQLKLADSQIADFCRIGCYYWDNAPLPNIPLTLKLASKTSLGQLYNYTFELSQATYYELYISRPYTGNITNWSFNISLHDYDVHTKEYEVTLRFGKWTKPFQFWILIEYPGIESGFGVIVNPEYTENEIAFSTDFKELLRYFPDWTNVIPFVTSFEEYEFGQQLIENRNRSTPS